MLPERYSDMDDITLGRAFAMATREYVRDIRKRKRGLPPLIAGQLARRLHEIANTQLTTAELFFQFKNGEDKPADSRVTRRHEADGSMSFSKARDALSGLMWHAILWTRADLYEESVNMWMWIDFLEASVETRRTLSRRKGFDSSSILTVFRKHLVAIARTEMSVNEAGFNRLLRDVGVNREEWDRHVGTILSHGPLQHESTTVH